MIVQDQDLQIFQSFQPTQNLPQLTKEQTAELQNLNERKNNLLTISSLLQIQIKQQKLNRSAKTLYNMIKKSNGNHYHSSEILQQRRREVQRRGSTIPSLVQIVKDSEQKMLNKRRKDLEIRKISKVPASQNYYESQDFELLDVDDLSHYVYRAMEHNIVDNILTVHGFNTQVYDQVAAISTPRNQEKVNNYALVISQFVTSSIEKMQITAIELLRKFKNISKNQMWKEIIRLFERVSVEKSTEQIYKQLIHSSCQLLEEKLNRKVPARFREFETFVADEGLWMFGEATKDFVYFNKQNKPIWAITYLLLRTGRMRQIELLSEEYHGQYNFYQDLHACLKGERRVYNMYSKNQDIFLEAIYSLFNRKAKCSRNIINNQQDYIWFSLRTSVSDNFSSTFALSTLQSKMQDIYQQQPLEQNYVNLLHCLSFDQFVRSNRYLDTQDTIHLSIFLHIVFSEQQTILWSRQTRQNFFTAVSNYSEQLSFFNLPSSIDYLLVCYDCNYNSVSSVLQRISNLLVYSDNVINYFGEQPTIDTQLQRRIRSTLEPTKQEYNVFIEYTITKYSASSGNYMYPAKVFQVLLQNSSRCIEFLLNVLVKDIQDRSQIKDEEIKQISRIINRLRGNEDKVWDRYSRLLDFILYTRYIKNLIQLNQKVDHRIFSSKYSPFRSEEKQSSLDYTVFLNDLNNSEYRGIYAVFLFYFMKVILRYYQRKDANVGEFVDVVHKFRRYVRGVSVEADRQKDKEFQERMRKIEMELEREIQIAI